MIVLNMLSIYCCSCLLFFFNACSGQMAEEERVRRWHERNDTWPPRWQQERPAFTEAMARRDKELQMIPGSHERWSNYLQYTQSRLLPRFTEVGFEVVDTPEHVRDLLYRTVQHEIDSNWDHIPLENLIDVVYTPIRSKFVDMRGVDREVMHELTTFHEEWAGGMKLKPTSSYGVRLYQNGSSLAFHYDKTHTHVISSIIHITHKYDNDDEPWPIEIEDHNGVMHAVNLEPGQMLFYESAVCLHGRRKTLKGQYYGSLFVHYQPIDVHIWNYTIEDVVEHVPLHWRNGVVETRGSRWSGASLTIDSLVTDGANKRIIDGEEITNISAYYDMLTEKGEVRDISSYYVNDDVTADEL